MAIRFPNRSTRDNTALDTSAYAAPRTEIVPLTDYHGEYNDSKFYSWNGRIGRIQYFAYPVMFMCAALVIFMLAFMALGGAASIAAGNVSDNLTGTLGLLMLPLLAGSAYIQLAATKRRFNDLNKPGWLMVLMLVPVVSFLASLYLMFMKGDAGRNDYGLPPPPPTKATIIAALIIPFIVFSGFAAAIALPAYQSYVNEKQTEANANADTTTVVTTQTQNVTVASATVPVNASASASAAVAAPTPSPEDQVAAALAKSAPPAPMPTGAPPTDSAPPMGEAQAAATNAPSNTQPNSPQPVNNDSPSAVTFANTPDSAPSQSDRAKGSDGKQSMSYEEFIKTSDTQVFADR